MCGIVGLVLKHSTGLTKQMEDVFDQLLYADALRGEDSTGVITVEKDSCFHIAKEATPSAWFGPQYRANNHAKSAWNYGKALIGHNRKKTIGKIEDETAHPFVVNDEFAMVHNGTLYNHLDLAKTAVDSEALAIVLHKAFEQDDYKEAVEETLGRVNGAYAVAMYDQRSHKVRLLRNKERPLCIVETPQGWFFASEGPMLFWILARNNIPMKDVKIELLQEHCLYEFDLDSNKLTTEVLTPKKPIPPTIQTGTVMAGTSGNLITFKPKTVNSTKMSKNKFKRERKRLVGTKIEWWCEDYIEVNFPKSEIDGEKDFFVMGVNDDIAYPHLIRTQVNLDALQVELGNDLPNALWSGTIQDMFYDKATSIVRIQLINAAPLPISLRSSLPVIDAEYIRKKLDEAEKTKSSLH